MIVNVLITKISIKSDKSNKNNKFRSELSAVSGVWDEN